MVAHPRTVTSCTWSIGIEGEFRTDLSVSSYLHGTSLITENLRQRYDDDSSQRDVSNLTSHEDMTVKDKMSFLWKDRDNDTGNRGVPDDGPDNIPDNDIDVDITQLPGIETYRKVIK